MKKFWIVLLSVALIMAFAMPVCAADVKFSGSFIAQGIYDNNRTLLKEGGMSVMNTWQRLRIQTVFQIQEGLSLTTKFDAMEKIWGASRSGTYPVSYNSSGWQNTGSAESENIKFSNAYVTANLGGGKLYVGYMTQGAWGTSFGDYTDQCYGPRIMYTYATGPWTFLALYDKVEGTQYYSTAGPSGNIGTASYQVDQEADKPAVAFMYNWDKGNAGFLFQYLQDSTGQMVGMTHDNPNPLLDTSWKRTWYVFAPYAKAQIGSLYIEGELIYLAGKTKKYDTSGNGIDQTKDGISGYVGLTYDFAPMYAGLNLVYVAGDDKGTADKEESGWPGCADFNPMLLLFNYDLARWNGNIGNPANSSVAVAGAGISNAQIVQFFVGVKPMPKLDIKASYAIAQADKDGTSTGWQSKNYGAELDLTATYKIYDNLSYMVGFAYLWAGDYFKGTNSGATVDNDYLVTHKLTLTF